MWRNKNVQRAKPEHVFVEPSPRRGRTFTALLSAVPSTPRYLTTRYFYIIIFYIIYLYFYLITTFLVSCTLHIQHRRYHLETLRESILIEGQIGKFTPFRCQMYSVCLNYITFSEKHNHLL